MKLKRMKDVKYTVEIKCTDYEMWAAQSVTVNAADICQ